MTTWAISGPDRTRLTHGSGEASFTVTNVTARAVRGHVIVSSAGAANTPMFKILGESPLEWAPNETKQVTVGVDVGRAAPGSYVYTVEVVSEQDSDERSDKLSSSFEVPPSAPPKRRTPAHHAPVAGSLKHPFQPPERPRRRRDDYNRSREGRC